MKAAEVRKRPYRMGVRAEAAAETRARILDAAVEQLGSRPFDEVSLADVAGAAGVTVQTVLRRFGSKEGLAAAATEVGLEAVRRERFEAPVGDVAGAVRNLMEHYEQWGDRSLVFLAQEQRVAAMREVTIAGRALHHEWVSLVFAPWLTGTRGKARDRLHAQLVASTDVYVWKIMRHDLGLDAKATEASMGELVAAIVERRGRRS